MVVMARCGNGNCGVVVVASWSSLVEVVVVAVMWQTLRLVFRAREDGGGEVANDKEGVGPPHLSGMGSQ